MEENHSPMAQKLLRAFMQFNRASWHQRTIQGYKPSEIMVLFCIKKAMVPDSEGLKVSEISGLLQVTSPTVTQLINSMEEEGLVVRSIDPSDRRAVRVKLTDKGAEITRRASEAALASFNGLIEHLGEEQSNQLAELLTQSFTYFKNKSAAAAAAPDTGSIADAAADAFTAASPSQAPSKGVEEA